MPDEKKYQKLRKEFDRIVRTELNYRATYRRGRKDLLAINETIEKRNRQVVKAHQKGEMPDILATLMIVHLQLKEGGKLHIVPEGLRQEHVAAYENRRYRFDTLFSAALMAMNDPFQREVVYEYQKIFADQYDRLTMILQLVARVGELQKAARDIDMDVHGDETIAYERLEALAPIRTELQNIGSQCKEFQKEIYLEESVFQLQGAIQSARRTISERSRKASRVLFDQAASIFHSFRGTTASLPNMERLVGQKESLERYLTIFENAKDDERKDRVTGYISNVTGTIERIRNDVQRQKEDEQRAVEKQQRAVKDAYERFQEIKEMFARGEIETESQRKNIGAKLRMYRDTLIANAHRLMAEEIDRFINATGIGKKETLHTADSDDSFDYKRGFYILLPLTIVLTFLVLFLLIV